MLRFVVIVFFVSEISKAVDMYMFLFDDILLLTRVKKAPRKVVSQFDHVALTLISRQCDNDNGK